MRFSINWLFEQCSKVCIIAIIHLVLILYGLYLTISDMINEEYPLSSHEATYVSCYYLIHFLLIFLLMAGTRKTMPLLYLPWLVVLFAILIGATCFYIESMINASTVYVIPSITNITLLGLGWFGWFTVFRNYTFLRWISKNSYKIISKE